MVTFTFYAQNFGRWEGPTNPILSLYDSWLSGRDTETLLAVIPKKKLKFLHSQMTGIQNISFAREPPGETFANYFHILHLPRFPVSTCLVCRFMVQSHSLLFSLMKGFTLNVLNLMLF